MSLSIVWFESDLRVSDHAPLSHAVESGGAVLPVFVWNDGAGYAGGGASQWWLHHSLLKFAESLATVGLPLIIRRGDPQQVLVEIANETGAKAVCWHERIDPVRKQRDRRVAEALRSAGIRTHVFAGEILHEPDRVQTTTGGPYQVFTPFHRKLNETITVGAPLPAPSVLPVNIPGRLPDSITIKELSLLPSFDWASGLRETWQTGERAARERLENFVDVAAAHYEYERDRPDREGTARLSAHLHFGEISPRQVLHRARGHRAFTRQIAWREFSYHLLHHFPHTPTEPLKAGWQHFPWASDPQGLRRWQTGRTGYPIVDAGMRQLWHTGWMHNRVRMIVASFLTKDLLLPWQHGAAWFEDTLVDMDVANNTLGWQWSAGSGADAQPFFRIFNPVSQGKRFDPEGAYVRRWIPELAAVPNRYIHAPWEEPAALREGYPSPIVDHAAARVRALDAYAVMRAQRDEPPAR